MNCPKCQETVADVLVAPEGMPITFMCNNNSCANYNQELYKCQGGILLTRQEFIERKRDEGEA